jgi:symplekin
MDVLSALINTLATLFKQRPTLANLIIQAVLTWTPQVAMTAQSPMSVRSVEKSVKILLHHIYRYVPSTFSPVIHISITSRSPQGAPYTRQIADTIQAQTARMEQAAQEARRKRTLDPDATESTKRAKLETPAVPTPPNVPTPVAESATPAFANFDFSTLPLPLVVDILIANLLALSDERLAVAISVSFLSRLQVNNN